MGCIWMPDGVLPIYGVDRGEEARRGHLLLPGGVRPRAWQAADHVPGVPGHCGRAGSGDARRRARAAGRVQHMDFGAVAAAWGVLEDLGVAAIIDQAAGARRADAGASVGAYLVLAALNRVVAPCSKLAFADWWAKTAAPRFTRLPASPLDHRQFWDAMHAITIEQLEEASRKVALRIVEASGVDVSSVALDMTNFATFIDTA